MQAHVELPGPPYLPVEYVRDPSPKRKQLLRRLATQNPFVHVRRVVWELALFWLRLARRVRRENQLPAPAAGTVKRRQ